MSTEISLTTRLELTRKVRCRYQEASGPAKKKILREFIATTGYNPNYAIQVLNAEDTAARTPSRRRRLGMYDEAAKQALIVLWEASDRVCGKRLWEPVPV